MSEDKEAFLSRWSRLKREQPVEKAAEPDAPAPVLPPVESLTTDSDFTGFMGPKVKDGLRRLALKKLFQDPHFNIPDPYEPFSGDWTVGEPITPEFLATLNQARTVLFADQGKKTEDEKPDEQVAEAPAMKQGEEIRGEAKQDESGRQDT